jgi:diguanylate cyclase (GGDEF)-like protein
MLIAVNVTLTLSVGLVARGKLRDGMAYWAAGLACNAAGYVLFALRGQVSDLLSIVLANVLVACVFALFTEGVFQFQKRRPRRWLVWLPVVVTALLFGALIPWQAARVVAGTIIFSAQSAAIMVSLLQRHKTTVGVGQYFMVAGFLMMIIAFAFQGVGTLLRKDEVTSIMTPHFVQTVIFLVATISVVVVSLGLVVMIKDRADELNRNLAMRDELTGLINRRSLLESLAQHLSAAKRHGQPLSLLMVDIDFFKRVNDTYGHLSGDKVLKTMASSIVQRTRAQDVPGRLGGEEFLVILPNSTEQGAWQLAENLRQGVEATAFQAVSGEPIAITVSIGLCALSQLPDPQCDDLIAASDQALYRAKAAGRNRVEVFVS